MSPKNTPRPVVTIREVALAAGVSQATAARALSGYGSVSSSAAERVAAAAERIGYRPNHIAQALRLGHTKTVGFIPGDLENPFFATVTRYLADALEESGYTLLVSSSNESPERESRLIETMRSHRVSSFVIAPSSGTEFPHLEQLVTESIPLVLLDRTLPRLAADSVTVDNRGGSRQAVQHLHQLGHEHIALLSDDLPIHSTRDRIEGFLDAAREFGFAKGSAEVIITEASRDGAYDSCARLLARRDRPTALFAADSTMSIGALRACADQGIDIPGELSLVAFDDFDLAHSGRPTVTTVRQPIAAMGDKAAELLLARLSGSTRPPQHVTLPTSLIVRRSSGHPYRRS